MAIAVSGDNGGAAGFVLRISDAPTDAGTFWNMVAQDGTGPRTAADSDPETLGDFELDPDMTEPPI